MQFGTSRFLQAHVDLFVHEAREAGQAVGPITVVQASGSAAHAGRVAAFGRPEGFPVVIRGIEDGRPAERTVMVTSVARGLSAARDWEEVAKEFATRTEAVVSNMGDMGYIVAAADRRYDLLDASSAAPTSFPAMLLALLWRRWRAGGAPLVVLPCELISRNGRVLHDTVLALARDVSAEAAFTRWLDEGVVWADTLVDRIVSQAIEPIGAVAEPYALWAIERRPGLESPCQHSAIVMVNDLEPFERLKIHVLNLGHTVLADLWLNEGGRPGETVRGMLADAGVRERLDGVYRREVLPGFAARGLEREAAAYVATTMDRFLNPFLDHLVADIAQNHAAKVERRVAAFLSWRAEAGPVPPAPGLEAIVDNNRGKSEGGP